MHGGAVDAYEGGYAAYVLARAERIRVAAGTEARRRNLMRKELAWLRRGAPARTSKPKFRIQAANDLIANEPEPRDSLALQRFATARLGKDVFDLHRVSFEVGEKTILDKLDWSIGPGVRIGLVGVNGTGKTSVLKLLTGELAADLGHRQARARRCRIGYLSQALVEMDGNERVLDAVENAKRITELAGGKEVSTATLLEDFGFTGDKLTTRLSELSGGERRRFQFLRLLLDEPNVLLLDEPTNDLDIDTLNVIEDYLDGWPGTLIVVTHDRYFLERVTDVTYALPGGGRCVLLPGGIEQYLAERPDGQRRFGDPSERSHRDRVGARAQGGKAVVPHRESAPQARRADRASCTRRWPTPPPTIVRLGELNDELRDLHARKESLEEEWLDAGRTS